MVPLRPRWQGWARQVLRFTTEELGVDLRGTRVLVAYSTGVDSTVLLHLLASWRAPLGIEVHAAHVHHGLRPEADLEAQKARAVCAALGVACHVERLKLSGDMASPGMEDQARQARYTWLENVRRATQSHWILTAHHANDLAEDILLRLVRGVGWPALAGMPGRDDTRRLLRPLLCCPKETLVRYAQEHGLSWCEDSSNCLPLTRRNRIRTQVLPLLCAENPRWLERCLDLWRLASRDAAFWQDQTRPLRLTRFFPNEFLRAMPAAQRLRVLATALRSLGPGQVRAQTLLRVDELWCHQRHPRCVQFPGDKCILVRADGLAVMPMFRRPQADFARTSFSL
ncbi:MAG: tRNA lysidine(34) synthetase TilS [Desulfomicrobiaceae bacterium]